MSTHHLRVLGGGAIRDTHAVLEKLMDHSERWRTMFFYLPYCAFKSFNRIRKRLPMLTDLSLGTDDDVAPDGLNMFEVAPSLRSLECVNFLAHRAALPVESAAGHAAAVREYRRLLGGARPRDEPDQDECRVRRGAGPRSRDRRIQSTRMCATST